MTGSNPTDRGKIGTKRHILTDQYGVPLSVVITAANTHDMKKAATETLDRTVVKRPLKKQNLCLDKGYDYPEIERESTKRRYVPHIRHRGVENELIKIEYVTKRWVGIERTNSWHNRFRKLLVRYEKKSENYLSCTRLFSLLYYRLQEDNFGIGS